MPGLYTHTTRASGTILTAVIYNGDHQNHIDNLTPQMTDDYSVNASQMQSITDPGEVGTESLATSLAGEMERLRFSINEIKTYLGLTSTHWYSTATGTVPFTKLDVNGLTEDSSPDSAADFFVSYDTSASAAKKVGIDTLLAMVLFSTIERTSASGTNAGAVTLPAAPNTAIASVSLGSLTAGDVILFEAQVTFNKGGTAGGNAIYLAKVSGTATISFLLGDNAWLSRYCQASTGETWRWFGFAAVTVTGTVTLGLEGTSAGSDSSIGIGGADIGAYVLRNG